MAIAFDERVVESSDASWPALVVTPESHVAVGQSRLEQLRAAAIPGAIDQKVLRRTRQGGGRFRLVLFRGQADDASGSWSLDDGLERPEQAELASLLMRSQLPTYRRLMAAGVLAVVHIEFEPHAIEAFRIGVDRLVEQFETELEKLGEPADDHSAAHNATLAADIWIMRNLVFFSTMSLARAVENLLPDKLRLLEQRAPHICDMLSGLPATAIG